MAFFLICPRFRRYWKTSDSDTRRSYQLKPARPSPDEEPEGNSSTREDARSSHHRGSSGLSDRLRRRFSREAKDLRVKPRAQRKSGSPGFPFSSKPANTSKGVITPDDIGSSLMSERGYDSDAQFISTPKQISHTRDHPTRIIQETVSPLRQEIERELSYDQGHGPQSETMADARLDRTVMEEPQPGLRSRNQTSWATQSSGSSAFRADDGSRRIRVARPQRGGGSPVHNKRNGSYPHQGYRPPVRMATPDPSMPRHGSGYSSPISPVPFPYTTSADSPAGPSQISVRKRRRQPPTGTMSDNCSIHLGDMNIPTMLASCSTSPRILSPKQSFDENRWATNAGTWNAPRPPHDPGAATGKAPFSQTGPRFRKAPVDHSSSCYSQKTSLSSAGIPSDSVDKQIQHQATSKELGAEPTAGFNCSPNSFLMESLYTSVTDNYADKAEAQRSKFTERFESDRSLTPLAHGLHDTESDLVSPRKVSVGWMSGGRRLGYGYTLVPANDGADQFPDRSDPCEASIPEQTRKTSPKMGDPGFDISSIMSRMRLRSLSSAFSEAGSDPMKFSLLEKLKRKKDQGDAGADGDAKNPWDFCSWVDPNQPVSGQSSPQKSSSVSTKSTEGRSVGRWATLRRTGSLLTKGRSVSAITRGLEAKATSRLTTPAGRYPVARRKEGRMLKFKVLDRKNKAKSADDDVPIVPIVPIEQSHGDADSGECQDEHVDDEQMIDTGAQIVERDRHHSSDKTGSEAITDDWKSTYQDCQEMLG
ncbi:uncharacterized protein BO80DRAFT_344140 [Aspergillus ibericus CBS 121593]|uniref:Uncharacterized protein n=1 Tax=Aspergillus ibericus CBS 121593 TaxID=1448316 RepID=A0A395HE93_9EURO|nr:hypothetical protein BO80DRAFT_344140 [Aspergillus ibericus CBS 121593]RAL05829.1 hypothetical protein BO80DRAFT_344140 [Aspergillus ibericus CBS 121593]